MNKKKTAFLPCVECPAPNACIAGATCLQRIAAERGGTLLGVEGGPLREPKKRIDELPGSWEVLIDVYGDARAANRDSSRERANLVGALWALIESSQAASRRASFEQATMKRRLGGNSLARALVKLLPTAPKSKARKPRKSARSR